MAYALGQMPGMCYPTVRVARCPSYDRCEICTGCTKYDHNNMDCVICEGRKPIEWVCVHTDKQQATKKMLDEKFRQSMFNPDQKPSEVGHEIAYDKKYTQELMELSEKFRPAIKDSLKRM